VVRAAREESQSKPGLVARVVLALLLVGVTAAAAAPKPICGDANGDRTRTAADALEILRVALDLSECEPCLCDVDGSGNVVTADALSVLALAVGGNIDLDCPSCVTTTTSTVPEKLPCGDPRAGAPACDGYCGVNNQMCVESPPGSGNCQCIFGPACGVAAGAPVCAGACPALWICEAQGNTCHCVF
jgi:hypothetical protein